ncbi:MAG: leucine-rich repeat domain-containing protein, partial [Clostridia bacterium]|nr:leucine-rich repeat domain-containing protein [Clostridia bacterium]
MGRIRRIVSVLLTIVMAAGVLPVLRPGALAADVAFSGYCGAEGEDGANISWSLSTDGVLTLTGEGEMKVGNYVGYQRAWQDWQVNASTNVKKVVIGEGVTNINRGAFENLEALTEVSIPGTVKRIEEQAFKGCVSLPEINIPEGVERISSYAFSGCGALKQFHIPASAISLGNPIAGCDGVETITVAESNKKYRSVGNCVISYGSEYASANGVLVCGCKKSVIPNDGSVTALGDSAFAGFTQLTEMKLPNSVTRLGYSVFNNSGIRSFHVPAKLEIIGGSQFEGCANLETITCDPDNKTYFATGNCLINKGRLSLVLGGVNSVIPDDGRVTTIDGYAFYGRKGLTAIDIPEDVTSIGEFAFDQTGLIDVTIPGSVTEIGRYAFSGCYDLVEVTISEGVTTIPERSFVNSNIEILTIPVSVTHINKEAFEQYRDEGDECNIDNIYYAGTEAQWNEIDWFGKDYNGDPYPDLIFPEGCLHFESVAPYHRVEEHTWDFGVITTAPTASDSGLMTYACTDPKCGVTRTEVIPA